MKLELNKKTSIGLNKTEVSHVEAQHCFNMGRIVTIEFFDKKGKWYAGYSYSLEYRKNLNDVMFTAEQFSDAKFFVIN